VLCYSLVRQERCGITGSATLKQLYNAKLSILSWYTMFADIRAGISENAHSVVEVITIDPTDILLPGAFFMLPIDYV